MKNKPLNLQQRFQYYASFIPGLQEEIADVVRERLDDVIIHKLLDGAILFETSVSYDKFNFLCFNNIFACLNVMNLAAMQPADVHSTNTLETHITAITRGKTISPEAEQVISHNSKKFQTFRIVTSQENQPAAIDEKLRKAAELYIEKLSGLKVNRAKPDAEFLFLYRKENTGHSFSCFLKRLTLRSSWEKSLHPGELPPPLAWMLCRLGKLKSGDTILDPFCGYGSIPLAALKYFHIHQFIASDLNKKTAAYTASRLKNHQNKFTHHKTDFSSLVSLIPKKSVDVIITDPPWGSYQKDISKSTPIAQLYEKMFQVFDILLKPEGRIVILGERNNNLKKAATECFTFKKDIPILLSGKKAAIFLFSKNC
jgi:tRNA G10  N-methylase Trm11